MGFYTNTLFHQGSFHPDAATTFAEHITFDDDQTLRSTVLIADCPDYAQIFVAPTALGIAYLRDCP